MEFQELDLKHFSQDNSMKEGNKVLELYNLQSEALSNLGRKLDVGDYIEELLHQHGFQNIVHRRYRVPLGIWPKDKKLVGIYLDEDILLTCSHRNQSVIFGIQNSLLG